MAAFNDSSSLESNWTIVRDVDYSRLIGHSLILTSLEYITSYIQFVNATRTLGSAGSDARIVGLPHRPRQDEHAWAVTHCCRAKTVSTLYSHESCTEPNPDSHGRG